MGKRRKGVMAHATRPPPAVQAQLAQQPGQPSEALTAAQKPVPAAVAVASSHRSVDEVYMKISTGGWPRRRARPAQQGAQRFFIGDDEDDSTNDIVDSRMDQVVAGFMPFGADHVQTAGLTHPAFLFFDHRLVLTPNRCDGISQSLNLSIVGGSLLGGRRNALLQLDAELER